MNTDTPKPTLRFGLAANRLHHESANSACFDWLRISATGIESLNIELHTVGRTFDAIQREGLLSAYPGLIRYPYGREGGLMKLVARVTEHQSVGHGGRHDAGGVRGERLEQVNRIAVLLDSPLERLLEAVMPL